MTVYYDLMVRLVAPYHVALVQFPTALWMTVSLLVVYRVFSDGALARAGDKILVPLLLLSVLSGIAAFVSGFLIFPVEAATASPLIRNHILVGSWSLVHWTAFLVIRWINGDTVWQRANRWVMLGLVALGTLLITFTGAVGGYIAGKPTTVSVAIGWLGWDVYHTFFVPDAMLWLILAGVVALPTLGWLGSRRSR